MRILNTLKACAGQEHRALLTHFLLVKKWIQAHQTPDHWPLKYLPKDNAALLVLAEEIDKFEIQQREQNGVTQ